MRAILDRRNRTDARSAAKAERGIRVSIDALLVFLAVTLVGFVIGTFIGLASGDELKKRFNLLGLILLAAIGVFLAAAVGPGILGEAYQRFEGIDLAKDGPVEGVMTAIFAGAIGFVAGLVILAVIELKRIIDECR